jgi:eukaryotic-like serine/threonine-protein kinase
VQIGTLFDGHYEIRDIKKGGLGIVYIAYDQEWKTILAIKTFQNFDISTSLAKERFIEESNNWLRLGHHDNVVLAHFYKVIANIPYLFLEYIEGPTLRSLVGTDYPHSAIVAHSIETCKALDYAYKGFRIIHRDIKPDNVFLTREKAGEFNIAKVTDFGLSKVIATNDFFGRPDSIPRVQKEIAQRTQGVLGTLLYVSPEQILNLKDIDHRSDIYSFGVMLFELTTGMPPFVPVTGLKGISPEMALLHQHLESTPRKPRRINPSIPRRLSNLVLKCLEKKREHRFCDYDELIEELSRIYKRIKTDSVKTSQDFREIVLVPEHSPLALMSNRACSLAEMGNYEEAIDIFDQILKRDPNNKLTLCNKASALYQLDRNDEAITIYKKALEIDESDPETWAMLGVVFRNCARYDDAFVCCDNAIRLAPENIRFLKDKADLLNQLRNFTNAMKLFERILELAPRDYEAWHALAQASEGCGRPWDAVKFYRKAIEINDAYAYSLDNLGSLLCQLGHAEEGLRYILEAVRIDANNPKTWNNLGVAYVISDNTQKARVCFQKAIELDPSYQPAKVSLEALDSKHQK